ncbi:transposable element Tcb1 transposase [Trichonephila clavipes]|nr:transposable element Tcb1 transposase [Trichonephila clavipes]
MFYASHGPVNTDVGLLTTGNTLSGLTSLVSNGIELMDVYGYGDNHMNPWTLLVKRGLFKLLEALCSWRNMGLLKRLDTSLKGDRYVSILSDFLHPFMVNVHSDGLGEFQQENTTLHTFRITIE